MEQVEELLDVIQALKLMGVTGASEMYSFFERRVQPLQNRCQSGRLKDPSRMSAEESQPREALNRVKHVLMDVHSVSYVPELFSASNQPKPGQKDLYRSSPLLPEIDRPDHLKPSAY
ncbi:hypothetical protein C2845_PM02G18220 [Panicum miliaceum]|uniref:Uncharacterized protein n=1 Tax=Panicum miliaceum TaxID=4540 RepID=A0A3L6S8B3_PANMI|nr:hypothetical protein C2845_PM02G18220 [Panicum miliaceum]